MSRTAMGAQPASPTGRSAGPPSTDPANTDPASTDPAQPDHRETGSWATPFVGLGPRLLCAGSAGLTAVAAFPPYGIWPLAVLSVAVLMLACRNLRATRGALVGLAYGLGLFLPVLHWSGVYVGVLPWSLLAISQAVFLALLGACAPALWRRPGAPVWLACLWVAVEAARGRVPFGGFPWARLAFSQVDAPYAGLAAVGGVPLVGFATALTATLLAAAAVRMLTHRAAATTRSIGALLLSALAVGTVGLLVPTPTGATRSATIAVVQGNVPRAGLDFNAEREQVLRNHVGATADLAEQVRTGELARPDLVLWPENSSDIDPFRNRDAGALIQSAADGIGVPVLVGAVVDGPGNRVSNTGVVWRPQVGPGARYVKRHPAPFAEYIPLRSIARRVSSKVDLVSRDFARGTVVRTLPMGPASVADVICFEVAYDRLVRDVVRAGGDLLVVQTNNATFGFTSESVQQLAMTRLRAIEHGRSTVQVSTVGVSAIVRPDGSVLADTDLFTRDVMVARVPLRTELTLADRVGGWPEAGLTLLAVAALAFGGLLGRRRRATRER